MGTYKQGKYLDKISVIHHKQESFSQVNDLLKREIESIICTVADKRSISALINLLDDNEYDVRWIAAESLIRIGRKSIVPLLLSLRDGKNLPYPGKAHHVLQCLLTRSEKKVLKPLLSILSGKPVINSSTGMEASIALQRVFRYAN